MNTYDFIHKLPAFIRWTAFEWCGKFLLGGRNYGLLAGMRAIEDVSFGVQLPVIENRLLKRIKINESQIVNYGFPDSYPVWFPRENAFESKWGYLFSHCRVDPRFGTVSTVDEHNKPDLMLVRSLIGFEVFMQGGMYEGMMPAKKQLEKKTVFPFASCFAYYHELVEVMLSALQARDWQPQMKILIHPQHPRYVDDMLKFFGFSAEDVLESSYPVDVEACIVIPHWQQRSAISMSDAVYLRERIYERIKIDVPSEKVYVSRRRAPSRSLRNEAELEDCLRSEGFRICYFEEMSVVEQFETIAKAKTIVAVHGSGLANLVSAQKGTRVVEIISPEWRRSTFARLSAELGLNYSFLEAEEQGDGRFAVSVDSVIKAINR